MASKSLPAEKLYYTIGEIAQIAGVKPHVLRYWEQEFPSLAPRKDESGRRIYRRHDVDVVMKIRRLLHDEKFTVAGARRALMAENLDPPDPATAQSVKEELRVILALLKGTDDAV